MNGSRGITCLTLCIALLASCRLPEEEPVTPATVVALGDSMTMGIQDAGLTPQGYLHCYPYLVAKQMGQAAGFAQPRATDPGIGVPPYERPLWLDNGRVEAEYLATGITQTALMQLVVGRLVAASLFYEAPYNNLGVNGARLDDLNSATGYATSRSGENFFYDIVLRNLDAPLPDFGGTTAVQQAIMLEPEYITLWIGNNDILGYVLGGGEDETLITSSDDFRTYLVEIIGDLLDPDSGVPGAQIVLANIPQYLPYAYALDDVFVESVGDVPVIFDPKTLQPIDFGGSTGYVPLLLDPTETGTVTHLLLTAAGAYIEEGLGIDPAALDSDQETQLAALGVTIPTSALPLTKDLLMTDVEEALALSTITDLATGFNAIIDDVAADYGIPVVDINTWMKPGGGSPPASDPVAGWDDCLDFVLVSQDDTIFSLDGVHASDYGHAFIANEFIHTMNAEFGLSIPLLNPEAYKGQYSGKAITAPSLKAIRGIQQMYAPVKR